MGWAGMSLWMAAEDLSNESPNSHSQNLNGSAHAKVRSSATHDTIHACVDFCYLVLIAISLHHV